MKSYGCAFLFLILTLLYWLTAAWVKWVTDSPSHWKSPTEIMLISFIWLIFAFIFLFGNPDDQNEKKT